MLIILLHPHSRAKSQYFFTEILFAAINMLKSFSTVQIGK